MKKLFVAILLIVLSAVLRQNAKAQELTIITKSDTLRDAASAIIERHTRILEKASTHLKRCESVHYLDINLPNPVFSGEGDVLEITITTKCRLITTEPNKDLLRGLKISLIGWYPHSEANTEMDRKANTRALVWMLGNVLERINRLLPQYCFFEPFMPIVNKSKEKSEAIFNAYCADYQWQRKAG